MRFVAWKYAILIAIVACLSGCGERPEAVGARPPVLTPATEIASAPDLPATPSKATVWFDPAALEDCAPPQVGTIHWDARKSTAESVDVKIVGDDGGENLFASGGPVGSQITEAWMRPGLMVIVRDQSSGAELGRNIVDAKPCSH